MPYFCSMANTILFEIKNFVSLYFDLIVIITSIIIKIYIKKKIKK